MGKIGWRRDRLPTPVFLGFPSWLSWKRIRLQCGRPGFDTWVGKIPWRRERLPSLLARRIPWTVQSVGLQRVEHNLATAKTNTVKLKKKKKPEITANGEVYPRRPSYSLVVE